MKKCERKSMSGLFKRRGIWRIDKTINGERFQESCGTSDLEEAERFFVHRLEVIRHAKIYGTRPKRIFREAAIKFLRENQHKRSIKDDACTLKGLDSFIGDLYLEKVHIGSLQPFIEARRKTNVKTRTINKGLQIVRHILKLAETEWRDESGLTWLERAPKIKLLDQRHDTRDACPISWMEQDRLFAELPSHLRNMALFAVNTGCRDREICRLRWEWEVQKPELGRQVFIIPGACVKNRDKRLVVLNDQALEVIESVRGENPIHVFTYEGKPITRMLNTAWRNARKRAKLPHLRVHDLKHTFGSRLRSAGVSYEDRQDLLGHKSSRITTHYSAAETGNLLVAANKVCTKKRRRPVRGILKTQASNEPITIHTEAV